jgi:hypothetical protein
MGAGKYNTGAQITQKFLGSAGFKLLRRRRWALLSSAFLRVFLGSCDVIGPGPGETGGARAITCRIT